MRAIYITSDSKPYSNLKRDAMKGVQYEQLRLHKIWLHWVLGRFT
jgi:hypothetical protein